MTNPYYALFFETVLASCILFLYFYIEPRFNKKTKKSRIHFVDFYFVYLYIEPKFLSMYNVFRMIIILPFMEFILGFLLQAKSCTTGSFSFCIAKPDIFTHSLFYDLFFLRVNDQPNGAHWIDYMFIPILFFITFYFTKDAFFSALNSAFMVFTHEVLWFIPYMIKYAPYLQYEGVISDVAFFILVGTIGFVGFTKYKRYYLNLTIFSGLGVFIGYLIAWYFLFNYQITTVNNVFLNSGSQFLQTQWYYSPVVNEIEVISWITIFLVFLVNTIVNTKNRKTSH